MPTAVDLAECVIKDAAGSFDPAAAYESNDEARCAASGVSGD